MGSHWPVGIEATCRNLKLFELFEVGGCNENRGSEVNTTAWEQMAGTLIQRLTNGDRLRLFYLKKQIP
jgi:hypothetical protein